MDAGPPDPAPTPSGETRPQRHKGLRAVFRENFIASVSPVCVARWAARHARESDSPTTDTEALTLVARADGDERASARSGAAPEHPAVAEIVPSETFWALTSRPLRTRTESQQMFEAVDGLLRTRGREALRVEVLPQGDDWLVVGWPFPRREDAERARALLLARGLRVEVVEF